MSSAESGGARYKAFVSYSRNDQRVAQRLQGALERYVLPAASRLVADGNPLPRNPLRPLFRDRDELVPGDDLSARIRDALNRSDFLIVICSPNAAGSKWVAKEVEDFLAMDRVHRLLCVVVAGEPNAVRNGHPAELECLPPPLKRLWEQAEPLWVDWRIPTTQRRTPFLMIVAALLDLKSLDQLVRRDRAARLRHAATLVGVAIGFCSVLAIAGVGGVEAERNRSRTFSTAAQIAFERGDMAIAEGYALLSLPASQGSLFDFSPPESRRIAARAAYHNDLLRRTPGSTAVSNDGLYSVARDQRFAELWNNNTNVLVGRYEWRDFLGGAKTTFSPDGRYLLADTAGDGITVVTTADGTTSQWPGTNDLNQFAVADKGDIAVVAEGSYTAPKLVVRDFPGRTLRRSIALPEWPDTIALSPRATYAALSYPRNSPQRDEVVVWNIATGEKLGTISGPDRSSVAANISPIFAPNERRLLIDWGGEAWVWHLQERRVSLAHPQDEVWDSVPQQPFSAAKDRLVLPNSDNSATIWDLSRNTPPRTLRLANSTLSWASISMDGRTVVTAGRNTAISLWDASTGRHLGTLSAPPGTDPPRFSSDDRRILRGAQWDARARRAPRIIMAARSRITNVAISGDESLIAAASEGRIGVWRFDGAPVATITTGVQYVSAMTFSPDQSLLMFSDGKTPRVWNTDTKQEVSFLANGLYRGVGVTSVAFSPSGQEIVVGLSDSTARVLDSRTGQERLNLRGHSNEVITLVFAPDGRQLATGSADNTGRLWDVRDGTLLGVLDGGSVPVSEIVYAPNGRRLVTLDVQSFRVWNARNGRLERVVAMPDAYAPSVTFTANGHRLIGAGMAWDGNTFKPTGVYENSNMASTIRSSVVVTRELVVADSLTGDPIVTLSPGPHSDSIVVSPITSNIIGGFEDGTVRIWAPPPSGDGRALAGELCRGATPHDVRLTAEALADPLVRNVVRRGDENPCGRRGVLSLHFWASLLGMSSSAHVQLAKAISR